MREFVKAVKADDETPEEREGGTTFPHWGRDVTFYEPSDGQQMLMLAMGGRAMPKEAASNFLQIFLGLADDDTRNYLMDLMMDPLSGFNLKGPGGVFDLWEGLVEEWSGKDSKKPSASPKSRRATGATSTATSRRRASTSSRSRSTASST